MKDVEIHWKNQALQRLREISIAEQAWKEESDDRLGQILLIGWAEGKFLELPPSLKKAISSPHGPAPKRWRQKIENLCGYFGDASISWLHEAIIQKANQGCH